MRYRNLLAFLALAFVWGTAFMAIKAGLGYFPPVLFAAFRFDLAAIIMLGYAVYATDRWRPKGRDEWLLVAVGGVFIIAGYHALLFIGEQNTTSATAAVIVSLSPVLTPALARAFLPNERLSRVGVAGILLGLVGVAVLTRPTPENLLGGDLLPKAFVFAAAVSFALGSVTSERISAALPAPTMEAWSMALGAIVLHAASVLSSESLAGVEVAIPGLAALGYLSVASSAVGFLIYFDLLSRLGPVEINLVSYVAPVFAALSGALLLGEVIDAVTVVGFVVIFSGFVLLKRRAIAAELPRVRAALSGE
ncbi:DMT family transporter [Halococcus sp. AFM35]|uniref:DMT family transporter n=1 Tax=Halococcus sp. AFM35 TaxID=3421653 RepID=UPI003EBE3826